MNLHIDHDTGSDGHDQEDRFDAVPTEGIQKAHSRIPVWGSNLCLPPHTAGLHPDSIVGKHLPQQTAKIEKRPASEDGGDYNCGLALFFIHLHHRLSGRGHLLPYPLLPS